MDILLVLKIIAALVTVATGLFSLLKPSAAYGFTGLSAEGVRGLSEMRSIFGGLFIGLGIAPFLLGDTGYTMLGIGYVAIAVARAISIVYDRSYEQSNIISLVTEIVLGIILVV